MRHDRIDGFAPIRDYALIGDGRTAALVAGDGTIDWMCLPNVDSPSAFGALLDADHGGSFLLQPAIPFQATRRYLPNTNVLETTFATERGTVRVVDAMTLPDENLAPMRELVRAVEGLSGEVPMRWRFARDSTTPRGADARVAAGAPVATWGREAAGVRSWDAGTPEWRGGAVESSFEIRTAAARCWCSRRRPASRSCCRADWRLKRGSTRRFTLGALVRRAPARPWRDMVVRSVLR